MTLSVSHTFVTAIPDDGTPTGGVQPSHWNAAHSLSGTVDATQMPALTGDVTTSSGAVATTLATVNGNVGSFTNASVTVNAKGLVTAASSGAAGATLGANTFTATQTITPAANTNALASTGYSLTGANAQSLVDLAGTWNTTGTPTLIKANVTDTASNAASKLLDLQVGGTSKLNILSSGQIQSGAYISSTAPQYSSITAPTTGIYQTTGVVGTVVTGTAQLAVLVDTHRLTSSVVAGWCSGNAVNTGIDTGTARNAAGVVEVNNGTAGTYRDLKLRALTSNYAAIGSTSTDGILLSNTTAAAAGAQQWSPRLHFTGQGWKTTATAASQTVDWIAEVQPVQGAANPTSNLVWSSQINGGGYTARMTLGSAGDGTSVANGATNLTLKRSDQSSFTPQTQIDLLDGGGVSRWTVGVHTNGVTFAGTKVWEIAASIAVAGTASFADIKGTFSNTYTCGTSGNFWLATYSTQYFIGATDLMLNRSAAATLQQGAANAAAPVAQTLQAQGSRSGTDTNVGGADYTIQSGNGTGTGTASSLIFKTPVAVASGTGAQTQTTGLMIKAGCAIRPSYTVANLPAAATVGAGAMAWVTDATATTFLSTVAGGGANSVPVSCDGTNWLIG